MAQATQYADEIESAAADILDAGAAVTFTRQMPGYYDARTDTTYGATTLVATGAALRVKPRFRDVMEFQAQGLVLTDPVTLIVAGLVVPSDGVVFDPMPGDSFAWNGLTYVVRYTDPTAPDGATVLSRIVGSR